MKLSRGVLALGAMASAVGCGMQNGTSGVAPVGASLTGRVHGGQQPVANATIQLYAVGTSGDGSAAAPLLAPAVMTDANGNFNLSPGGTRLYSCTNATEVYLVATGGNPGTSGANANLAMMTALGPCSGLSTSGFISVNELTTVAAVDALAPYMTGYANVGSGSGDAAALANAFTLAGELANSSTGTTPGVNVPSGYTVTVALMNTLADIVSTCINSTGGVATNTSTNCGQLFSLTTPPSQAAPTDTIGAVMYLAQHPMLNTDAVFGMTPSNGPFQPTLTQTPPGFRARLMPASGSGYVLQINPPSVDFGSLPAGFTTNPVAMTIANNGATAVSITSLSVIGTNAGDFSLQTLYCPAMLPAGDYCRLQLTASPSATGVRSGYLSVVSGTVDSPQYVALSVTGTTASAGPATAAPSPLTFSVAGALADVTVSNYGTGPLSFSSVVETAGTPNGFVVQPDNCGPQLPASSLCTIPVLATQASGDSNGNPKTYTGTLTVYDDASAGPQVVQLSSANRGIFSGNGTVTFGAGQIGVTQTAPAVTYGPFTAYTASDAVNMSLQGANPGDFAFSVTQGGATVSNCQPTSYISNPGQSSCVFTFSFTPTAIGLRTAKAMVSSNEYLLLKGTGAGPGASFTVNKASVDLIGALPSSPDPNSNTQATASFTITNTGTTTYGFAVSFTGANASLMSANGSTCGSVAPQGPCTATVSFASTTPGNYAATMVVGDVNSGYTVSVPITAQEVYWNVAAFPNQLNFYNQPVGTTSAEQTFVLGDLNEYPLGHDLSVALQASSKFTLTRGTTCTASLVSTCTLGVTFTPTVAGTVNELATVTDTVSGDTATLALYGSGGAPAVSLAPVPVTFADRAVMTTSMPQTVTLTNTGSLPLAVSHVTVVGAVNGNFSETDTCNNAVAPGGTCSINVTFAPTATGTQSATVRVDSTAASTPDSFMVSGTAH